MGASRRNCTWVSEEFVCTDMIAAVGETAGREKQEKE